MSPAASCGCPWHGPGLESRAGESKGFWLLAEPINQGGKFGSGSPHLLLSLCLSAGDPSCLTGPEWKCFALGYSTCQKLFLPSPCFALKVSSGLKEKRPLKPQRKVSFTKGQHLPSASLPQGFALQFSQIQPDVTNDSTSWIVRLLAGLRFTDSIVPSSMGELMEVGVQVLSWCLTLLSPSRSGVLSSTPDVAVPSRPPISSACIKRGQTFPSLSLGNPICCVFD